MMFNNNAFWPDCNPKQDNHISLVIKSYYHQHKSISFICPSKLYGCCQLLCIKLTLNKQEKTWNSPWLMSSPYLASSLWSDHMNVDACFQIKKYEPYMLCQYLGKDQHLKHGEFIILQLDVEKVQNWKKNQQHCQNTIYQIQLFYQLRNSTPFWQIAMYLQNVGKLIFTDTKKHQKYYNN